ncbi:MAG TPA: sigma-70 family RNA polymerase sigma factor [Pyrinomonadaceae bacterium]|jgi:RNA polymerase sigma-70 factor (ECF subfamily)
MASPRKSIEPEPRRPDGAALVELIAGGDESALAALYDATCGLIYGLLLRILGSSAAAEEVLAAVYREVWERAAAYDDEREKPMTWLITMAHGRAIARLRADGQNEERQPGDLKTAGRVPTVEPETDGFNCERQRLVRAALAALPPAEQQMIELAYFSGLRQNEIAARVGLSPQSVRAGIRAGMMRLCGAFESHPLTN